MSVKRLLLATSVALLALAALVGVASSQTFPDGNVVYLTGTADPVGTCIVGTEYYRTDTATRFSCTDGTWGAYADTGGTAPLVISDTQLYYEMVSPSELNFVMDFDDDKDNNVVLSWTGIAEADKSIKINQDVDDPRFQITVAETDSSESGQLNIREDSIIITSSDATGSHTLTISASATSDNFNGAQWISFGNGNVALTDATTTDLVLFSMGSNADMSGFFTFWDSVSTVKQTMTAAYSYACVSDAANNETCDIDLVSESIAVVSGTLACTPSFDTTLSLSVMLEINCDTSNDNGHTLDWVVETLDPSTYTLQ